MVQNNQGNKQKQWGNHAKYSCFDKKWDVYINCDRIKKYSKTSCVKLIFYRNDVKNNWTAVPSLYGAFSCRNEIFGHQKVNHNGAMFPIFPAVRSVFVVAQYEIWHCAIFCFFLQITHLFSTPEDSLYTALNSYMGTFIAFFCSIFPAYLLLQVGFTQCFITNNTFYFYIYLNL